MISCETYSIDMHGWQSAVHGEMARLIEFAHRTDCASRSVDAVNTTTRGRHEHGRPMTQACGSGPHWTGPPTIQNSAKSNCSTELVPERAELPYDAIISIPKVLYRMFSPPVFLCLLSCQIC